MKIEVEIDEDDVKYELRTSILKGLKPYHIQDKMDHLVNQILNREIEKHIKYIGLNGLIKQGVIAYLEKYKIRDVVSTLKISDLVKK